MYCTRLIDLVALRISDGLGSGLLRPAPGTWGTAAAWLTLALLAPSIHTRLLVFLLIIPVLFWAISHTQNRLSLHDPGWIVADEWHGLLLGWIFLPESPDWSQQTLLFVLFRLLDATKPWFIGQTDRQLEGAAGILIDDWLAGLIAGMLTLLATTGG